jgi:hypothetical protein
LFGRTFSFQVTGFGGNYFRQLRELPPQRNVRVDIADKRWNRVTGQAGQNKPREAWETTEEFDLEQREH